MRKLKNDELDRLDTTAFKKSPKWPVRLVLDNIRSLNNIGSVFRTADAFLVEKIYLCGITAVPPHKDIRKTALGATESVAWEYHESTVNLVSELKEQGFRLLAVEQAEGSTPLQEVQFDKNDRCVFVFGNEVKGVAQEVVDLCDEVVEIPQFGTKHSLNISVSVGMVIWDAWTKFRSLT